jgi:hypothetical protein
MPVYVVDTADWARKRLLAADLPCVLGHADFERLRRATNANTSAKSGRWTPTWLGLRISPAVSGPGQNGGTSAGFSEQCVEASATAQCQPDVNITPA